MLAFNYNEYPAKCQRMNSRILYSNSSTPLYKREPQHISFLILEPPK